MAGARSLIDRLIDRRFVPSRPRSWRMFELKTLFRVSLAAAAVVFSLPAMAVQLSGDARAVIPHDLQQLVVVDYRAMQNSDAAMQLKERVMPADLRQFDEAVQKSGINDNHDVDSLAFVLYRTSPSSEELETVGIAQGQFPVEDMIAKFRTQKVRPTVIRTNRVYPMGKTGMVLCFVDPSTMVFGSSAAVKQALDARDGLAPSMLTNESIMDEMKSVESEPLWSVLDQKGTQTLMRNLLGQAGSVTDYDSVRKRLVGSWYTMDFQHGVKFDLTITTGDTFAAATVSSLLNAAALYKKMSGSDAEKAALSATDISSNSGELVVHFETSDSQFDTLLKSELFQSVVH